MALFTEVAGVKGELKLAKYVADKAENGTKKRQEKKKEEKKIKNKKSKKGKRKQMNDEAWKKIPLF